jgi:hypothetical protein
MVSISTTAETAFDTKLSPKGLLERLHELLAVYWEASVGTKPSVHTSVSTYELEDFSKPLNQDTEGWITVKNSSRKNSRKKAVTFL